jgi:hypothetical protein
MRGRSSLAGGFDDGAQGVHVGAEFLPSERCQRQPGAGTASGVALTHQNQSCLFQDGHLLWDEQTFRFSTTRSRAKFLNLRRDPASLLIDDYENEFHVVAYGAAELIEDGHAELAQPLIEKDLPPEPSRKPGVDPRPRHRAFPPGPHTDRTLTRDAPGRAAGHPGRPAHRDDPARSSPRPG